MSSKNNNFICEFCKKEIKYDILNNHNEECESINFLKNYPINDNKKVINNKYYIKKCCIIL